MSTYLREANLGLLLLSSISSQSKPIYTNLANSLYRVYVEFMVNEVVKEEKQLLEADLTTKNDDEVSVMESPKKMSLGSLLDASSPVNIRLKPQPERSHEETSILVPFQLPKLVGNQESSVKKEEEEGKQNK